MVISYDSKKTLNDQIETILGNLKTECDARITAAGQQVRKREHEHKLHETNKRKIAAEQERLARLEKAEEEAKENDRAAREKSDKEAKELEAAERKRIARLRKLERESKEKARVTPKRLAKETKALDAAEQRRVSEQKVKENYFLACEKTEKETKGLEEIAQLKIAKRKAKDLDRVARKKFEFENKKREAIEKRGIVPQKKSRNESKEKGRLASQNVATEANEFDRKPQKLSEQGPSDNRKYRDREEAVRKADSSFLELSGLVEDKSCNAYAADEESVDMGCFTQREGLRVPAVKSNTKESEELPRSQTRVHWGRIDDMASINADFEKSSTKPRSRSNLPLSTVTIDFNHIVDDVGDEGIDHVLDKLYEAPIRGRKGKLVYGSGRGKENSSPLKDKTLSDSSYGDVRKKKTPDSSTSRLASSSYSHRRTSSQEESHEKCKKPPSSSSRSRSNEIKSRTINDELRQTSPSDRRQKRYKPCLPQEPSLKLTSESSLITSSSSNRISSSKKAMNDQSDLSLTIGRRPSKSAKSLRSRDDVAHSGYSGHQVDLKVESLTSLKLSSKKRGRDPDCFGYTQTSGIASGERASLANKPRRRKKTSLGGSVIAASIGDSQANRLKSQKIQSSSGGFGGIGDYDFAF